MQKEPVRKVISVSKKKRKLENGFGRTEMVVYHTHLGSGGKIQSRTRHELVTK